MEQIEGRRKYSLSSESMVGKFSDDTEGMPKLFIEENYELELINNMRVGWN